MLTRRNQFDFTGEWGSDACRLICASCEQVSLGVNGKGRFGSIKVWVLSSGLSKIQTTAHLSIKGHVQDWDNIATLQFMRQSGSAASSPWHIHDNHSERFLWWTGGLTRVAWLLERAAQVAMPATHSKLSAICLQITACLGAGFEIGLTFSSMVKDWSMGLLCQQAFPHMCMCIMQVGCFSCGHQALSYREGRQGLQRCMHRRLNPKLWWATQSASTGTDQRLIIWWMVSSSDFCFRFKTAAGNRPFHASNCLQGWNCLQGCLAWLGRTWARTGDFRKYQETSWMSLKNNMCCN